MEQKQRRKLLNNPFPGQPRAIGFVQGRLFFDPGLVPSQVCTVGRDRDDDRGFTLHWSAEKGVLWVEHSDDPGRSLWSTAEGSPFVSAGFGDETVEEFRGSFAIHDDVKMVCKYQTVDKITVISSNDDLPAKQASTDQQNCPLKQFCARKADGDGAELIVKAPAVVISGRLYSDEEAAAAEFDCGLSGVKQGFVGSYFRSRIHNNNSNAACSVHLHYRLAFAERRDHHLGFSLELGQPRVAKSSSSLSTRRVHDAEVVEEVDEWFWHESLSLSFWNLIGRKTGKRDSGMREEFLARKQESLSVQARGHQVPKMNRVQLTYLSSSNERFFGFGEQFSCFDLKGRRVSVLVQEQGLGRGDQPITAAANLISYRAGGRWDTTYAPAPYYMTSELRCVFLENYEYSIFDLQRHDRVQIQVHAGGMEGRILHGKSPAELLMRYTEAVGRMRELPDWIIEGAVVGMQGGRKSVQQVLNELKKHRVPISAFWLQDWVGQRKTSIGWQLWWNWEADSGHYEGWEDLVKELRAEGIRTMTYCNPLLASVELKENKRRNLLQEAKLNSYLVREPCGKPYMIKNTSFDAGMVDLTNPAARFWLKDILRGMIRTGIRGWMADFGEALPFDSVLFSGENPAQMHNRYPELWAELNREVVEEWEVEQAKLSNEEDGDEKLVFFMRAGYRESPRWSTLFWEGDQMVSWQKNDGIKSAVVGLLSSGISGFSLNHSDIGGYTTVEFPFVKYVRTQELLIRWMELNAFSVIFRTHEGNVPGANSQFYSNSTTMRYFARCAKLYKAWDFYRKQLVKEASSSGMPVVRHLFLHYPSDEFVWTISHQQFLVGSEILVVPVLDKGKNKVLAYFPAGDSWELIWSKGLYGGCRGATRFWVEAPLGFPAVFVRSESDVKAKLYKNLEELGLIG